jgi:polyphosphate kinase
MDSYLFFNRDLSWLTFNERVLEEANDAKVPLLERIRFLSIFSSNLDEFYRVRMPVLRALKEDIDPVAGHTNYDEAKRMINEQQALYGRIVTITILPELLKLNVYWLYNKPIPPAITAITDQLFDEKIRAFINPVWIDLENRDFFAENNKLYQGVFLQGTEGTEQLAFINIPVDQVSRLIEITNGERRYIVFLDDIIKDNLPKLFPSHEVVAAYNIKVTRDAEMRVEDEVDANIISALERELARRDYGPATRFLCQPGVPLRHLYKMVYVLNLTQAGIVLGGFYHNLKDLSNFPFVDPALEYPKWPAVPAIPAVAAVAIFDQIREKDIMIHVPYEQFQPILDFFNAAAADPSVIEVYCTLYRVANPSEIIKALTSAALAGKRVVVMLELKARFDEANNIKWANELKAAGVKIIYSSSNFKVHAKVALVKRVYNNKLEYFGLLSTGNLNESTARFYTDHILLTAFEPMLQELETLFGFLGKKKKKPGFNEGIDFKHLLVAQFNLQSKFLALIDREIGFAEAGKPASITMKLNNLEEKVLISKLYEASNAGVQVHSIVRSVCCLVPGVKGQSENIVVKRIVDRFLEHGRVFLFHNNGEEELYMGSADWMNRNIYSRIEVCFPVYDLELKNKLRNILLLQWKDTGQAVYFTSDMKNVPVDIDGTFRSQEEIYKLLSQEVKPEDYETK